MEIDDDIFALRVFVVHEWQDDGNDASPIEAYTNEDNAKERCAMRPHHLTYTRVPVVDAS